MREWRFFGEMKTFRNIPLCLVTNLMCSSPILGIPPPHHLFLHCCQQHTLFSPMLPRPLKDTFNLGLRGSLILRSILRSSQPRELWSRQTKLSQIWKLTPTIFRLLLRLHLSIGLKLERYTSKQSVKNNKRIMTNVIQISIICWATANHSIIQSSQWSHLLQRK